MSQSTHSRMLRLERENRCLLRTVEELQADPLKSSTPQKRAPVRRDPVQRCLRARQTANEDPPRLHGGGFEEAPSQFVKGPVVLGEGQPEDLTSELEEFEDDQNKLCCFVEPCEGGVNGDGRTNPSARSSYAVKQTQRLEAKCRTLDTVNQHLQTALDNSGTSNTSGVARLLSFFFFFTFLFSYL